MKLETGEDDLAYMWQRTGLDSQVREARHQVMKFFVTGHPAIITHIYKIIATIKDSVSAFT